jgi:hypothetical protein
MGTPGTWLTRLARFLLLLAAAVAFIVLSSGIAAYCVSRQMRSLIENTVAKRDRPDRMPEGTISIDFYEASGITRGEFQAFLGKRAIEDGGGDFPVVVTLQNAEGRFLCDVPVLIQWESGSQRIWIGKSGIIRFPITSDKLPGLKLVAPRGYSLLKQRSIPLGTAYEPEEAFDGPDFAYDIVRDSRIESAITRQLWRMKASDGAFTPDRLQEQLQRTHVGLTLPAPPREEMTAAEIYQRCKRSVVIVATLLADGQVVTASGVVLDSSGVIATAYHVLNKPDAVARGAMTFDGAMYPIAEVLAADQPSDVALARIDAEGLLAAPLSEGDPEGSPVTVISHPGSEYFTLTRGVIGRYLAITQYGRVALQMSVTADFADGSSGGPVFNDHGAVTGIVSATRPLGDQMVSRLAAPAACIRALLQTPADRGKSP